MKSVGPAMGWLCAERSCTRRLTPAHSTSHLHSDHGLVELDCGAVDPYVPSRLTISISDLLQRVVVMPSPWLCCCRSHLFDSAAASSMVIFLTVFAYCGSYGSLSSLSL